ncbi:hypothetical protein [Reyranella sp.]|uniref:hypothetical protein n=1 Tax=Reyranella sp. TaxID=1929291 RepID=UPI003D0B7C95
MGYMPTYRVCNPAPWQWTPWLLGPSLLAWWSADHTNLITMPGGLVSSWKDAVAGYEAVQAVGAAQPVWQAGGFGWRAVVAFDGVDDELTYASMVGLPTGATPCEEWYAVDQQQDASFTSAVVLGSSGGSSSGNRRALIRSVVSGTNRAGANDGSNSVTQGSADFSGRHVVRSIADGSTLTVEVDGVAATPIASVPSIGTVRARFAASHTTTPSSYAKAAIADRLFTAPLSATQANLLRAYLTKGL